MTFLVVQLLIYANALLFSGIYVLFKARELDILKENECLAVFRIIFILELINFHENFILLHLVYFILYCNFNTGLKQFKLVSERGN